MHTQFAQAADLKIDAENCLSMPRDFAWNPLKFNILSLDFVDVSYVQRSIEQRVIFHLGLVLRKFSCFYDFREFRDFHQNRENKFSRK